MAPFFRLTTWNINSVRIRLDLLRQLSDQIKPDVLCLQETKATDQHFPSAALEEMGYPYQFFSGIKGYNGVAILSRQPIVSPERMNWCGRKDARHICVRLEDGTQIHNLYVPAGGDDPTPETNEKFRHKLDFLDELTGWFSTRKKSSGPMILCGDLNIAPLPTDVWDHKRLLKVISHTPLEVEELSRLQQSCGWIDAVRHFVPDEEHLYTWWSYRAKDWLKMNKGRRLDHIWVTPDLKSRLTQAHILTPARGWERPSDHVPVSVDIARP